MTAILLIHAVIIGTNPQRRRATAENGENSPSGERDPSKRRRRRKHVCWLNIKFRFFCRHAKYIILQKLFLSYTKYFLIWRSLCSKGQMIRYKILAREGSNPQILRDYETGHGLTPPEGVRAASCVLDGIRAAQQVSPHRRDRRLMRKRKERPDLER